MISKYNKWCEKYGIDTSGITLEIEKASALIKYFYLKDEYSFADYECIIEYFLQMMGDFDFEEFEEIIYVEKRVKCNYGDLYLEMLSMAIRYAGDNEFGYAYGGIEKIRLYGKTLSEKVVERLLKYNDRLKNKMLGNYIRNRNIFELLNNTNLSESEYDKLMFRYLDVPILGNRVIRKVSALIERLYPDYKYVDDKIIEESYYHILENVNKKCLYIKVEYVDYSLYISLKESLDKIDDIFEAKISLDREKSNIIYILKNGDKEKSFQIPFDRDGYDSDKYDKYDFLLNDLFKFNFSGHFELIYLYGENIYELPPQHLAFNGKFKVEVTDHFLKVTENNGYEPIPEGFFGKKIKSIHALIGKNGSGKSSIFELLCRCNIWENISYEKKEYGKYFLIYQIGENYYYTHNTNYEIVLQTKTLINNHHVPIDLKICKISNVFDIYNFNCFDYITGNRVIDLTTQSLMHMPDVSAQEEKLRIKNYQLTFQNDMDMIVNGLDRFENKVVGDALEKFSSGERARITLFARLLSIFHVNESLKGRLNARDRVANYVILLDEAELYFHPAWQRKLIFDIRNFLMAIDKKFDVFDNISIIFSSNSPFYMSDLPDCVIHRLGGEEEEKTFGKNIYGILKTKFFMEEGVMGAFAQEKLDWALKLLADDVINEEVEECSNNKELTQTEIEEIQYLINIVGDPMLKEIMQEQLIEKGYRIDV